MKRNYFWDDISEEIWKIMRCFFRKEEYIFEIGYSEGHFLYKLYEEGYTKLGGIEIREDIAYATKEGVIQRNMDIDLMVGNILDMEKEADVIYSTGLIQCLDRAKRYDMFEHLRRIAPKALYVVPEILYDRNIGSKERVAVTGCMEYVTGNLIYELSRFYPKVREGLIERVGEGKSLLNDNFLYYLCEM